MPLFSVTFAVFLLVVSLFLLLLLCFDVLSVVKTEIPGAFIGIVTDVRLVMASADVANVDDSGQQFIV